MQRKQGFPVANCSIKMPESSNMPIEGVLEEEEPLQRRQQLINFGHAQWGFNNWNWSVTKQDLDFVELSNGKYTAGVVAFVSVKVKTLDIHRENIGYATSLAPNKGAAIHRARKCAVTNALRETLLSFGGAVATELVELLDARRLEPVEPPGDSTANALNRLAEPRNSPQAQAGSRKEPAPPCVAVKSASIPPVAKAHPMPANLPPAANRAPPANAPRPPPPPPAAPPAAPAPPRPGSNEVKSEALTEEEVRAERKRRQKLAQEEFRLKHLLKQKDTDENQDINKNCSLDTLLMAIPSQEIVVEGTEKIVDGKRKSPMSDGSNKRRNVLNTLTNT